MDGIVTAAIRRRGRRFPKVKYGESFGNRGIARKGEDHQ
jgi:hypothetical protein